MFGWKHLRANDVVCALGLALLLPGVASAQDAHYWTNQYGTRAELLGGLVVGSVVDLSASYYNPGALAHVSNPTLILTTDAWELVGITLNNRAGEEFDLSSTRLRAAPRIFAFQIPSEESKHKFAVSVLTRHDFDLEVEAGAVIPRDSVTSGASDFVASAETTRRATLSEGWAGFTWAYPLSGRVGVGATGYLALRSRRIRRQLTASLVDTAGVGTATIDYDDLRYWNVRGLAKIGLQFDFSPVQVGVTLTTPGLSLFGEGETKVNVSVINPDTLTTELDGSELVADTQKGLPSTYKSPLTIAVGAEYDFGRTSLYISGEWFDAVDAYTIVDADPFVGQTTGDTLSADIIQSLDAVINLGVAAEHTLSDMVELYAAVFTDRSAFDRDAEDPLPIATWDILHFTAGAAFQVGSSELTLGASYGHGNGEALPIEFLGQPTDIRGTYRSFKLILGFQLAL